MCRKIISLHVPNFIRHVVKVRVSHRIFRRYAVRWITLEHVLQQVQTLFIKARHKVVQRLRLILFDLRRVQRKVFEAWPFFLLRGASANENFLKLFLLVLAHKEGNARHDFCEDTPN
jgi:hypothetical protein